jgi:hypothetical protein
MKCKACLYRCETEEELDEHLLDAHGCGPYAPQLICPYSMLHVRDLLIESMKPDWMSDPDQKEHADKIWSLLEPLDRATVHHLLWVLENNGYRIEGGGDPTEVGPSLL